MKFEVVRRERPTSAYCGYGSTMVRIPNSTWFLSTLPSGKLYACDPLTGAVRTGKRVAGELRGVVFDVGVADGPAQGWALATFGLARISVDSLSRTSPTVRQGIGKYQGRMVALSDDVLGISSFYGRSMLLVSRRDGSVIKRIRMSAPELVHPTRDGGHRCWSFHHAVATDLDLTSQQARTRHPLPYGKTAAMIGDHVVALCGAGDDFHSENGTAYPTYVIAFDPHTLAEVWRADAPEESIEVLGQDASGRIVITSRRAVSVLTRDSHDVEGVYEHPDDLGGALLIAEHNCVVVHDQLPSSAEYSVVRWS